MLPENIYTTGITLLYDRKMFIILATGVVSIPIFTCSVCGLPEMFIVEIFASLLTLNFKQIKLTKVKFLQA